MCLGSSGGRGGEGVFLWARYPCGYGGDVSRMRVVSEGEMEPRVLLLPALARDALY